LTLALQLCCIHCHFSWFVNRSYGIVSFTMWLFFCISRFADFSSFYALVSFTAISFAIPTSLYSKPVFRAVFLMDRLFGRKGWSPFFPQTGLFFFSPLRPFHRHRRRVSIESFECRPFCQYTFLPGSFSSQRNRLKQFSFLFLPFSSAE